MSIETELLEMSGVKSKKGEKRPDYLVRLVNKVQSVADADEAKWDELSTEAQNWMNAATDAVKAEEPVEDFEDGDDEATEETAEEETEAEDEEEGAETEKESDEPEDEEDEEEKTVTKKAKKPAKKAAAEKEPAKKVAKKTEEKTEKVAKKKTAPAEKAPRQAGSPKDTGMKVRIKKLLIKKPSMSVEDLMTKLEGNGAASPSKYTVAGIRADFRHSLHVLKGEGLLDIEI